MAKKKKAAQFKHTHESHHGRGLERWLSRETHKVVPSFPCSCSRRSRRITSWER